MSSSKQPAVEEPGFQKTTLSNGVRVITESIPSVRSISVGVWVHTGSRDESEKMAGISHFIEHMVFKGTKKRRMHQIANRLESVGGYLNAFTGKEFTCYFARALDEHLERAVDVVCDLVLQPTFPEKELVREKDVVLEEIKMYEDVPEDLIFDRFESLIYNGHNLGRPVIGFPETVKSFTRDDLVQYMDARYTPNRTVLSVAGNVDHDKVVRFAEKAFGVTSRKATMAQSVKANGYTPREYAESRAIHQAHLVVGTRGFGIHNDNRIVLTVLNTVLGGGMSSRLNQNIREKYGYCYNIYSFTNMYSDTGDFGIYMGTDSSKINHARKLIQRELDKLMQENISSRKLAQAINQVKGSLMLGLESMSNRMMRIARQELFFDRYFTLDEVLEAVDQVSAEEIREVAQSLFEAERFSHVVLQPST
ncbi:MAG: M16 family metallopeptidase [Rhodothermales bacterium]